MIVSAKSLSDTKNLAYKFAKSLDESGLFVTLTGDIGAGKTQFIRYVLEYLNVTTSVTSPSFVILNQYVCDKFPIYHFDLYRLEEKGLKSIVDELREYSKEGVLTFVEWAEFGFDEIPKNSFKISLKYDENDLNIRYFDFSNNESSPFLDRFLKELK